MLESNLGDFLRPGVVNNFKSPEQSAPLTKVKAGLQLLGEAQFFLVLGQTMRHFYELLELFLCVCDFCVA